MPNCLPVVDANFQMKILKKLKSLLNPTKDNSPDQTHLSPISQRVEQWLDGKRWSYEHILPLENDPLRTHVFLAGFQDGNFRWTLSLLVHEKNQVVSFQGRIDETINSKYFVTVMAIFGAMNMELSVGNFQFDPNTGELSVKVGLDAEYCLLGEAAFNCYFQNLADLTEKAWEVLTLITQDPNPSQDLLAVLKSQANYRYLTTNDSDATFYVNTHARAS